MRDFDNQIKDRKFIHGDSLLLHQFFSTKYTKTILQVYFECAYFWYFGRGIPLYIYRGVRHLLTFATITVLYYMTRAVKVSRPKIINRARAPVGRQSERDGGRGQKHRWADRERETGGEAFNRLIDR